MLILSLNSLTLSYNEIESIDNSSFIGFVSLVSLNLNVSS